ncbi:unnamed protein product [Diamesa tonsa]
MKSCTGKVIAFPFKEKELFNRLEELDKYQENEQQNLLDNQNRQLAYLTQEQRKMYEVLGISLSSFAILEPQQNFVMSESENEFEDIDQNQVSDNEEHSSDNENNDEDIIKTDYNNQLVTNEILTSPLKDIEELKDSEQDQDEKPKKPFLKRGSGLTARFKVHPDTFKLQNLPRYKYTDRVMSNLGRENNNEKPLETKVKPVISRTGLKATIPTKKPEPIKKVVTNKPESTELVLPTNCNLKINPSDKKVNEDQQAETKVAEWFQTYTKNTRKEATEDINETPRTTKVHQGTLTKGVSWANILSSNNFVDRPMSVLNLDTKPDESILQNIVMEQRNMDVEDQNLFELLEEKIGNMSFGSNSSTIFKILASLQDKSEEEKSLLGPEDPLIDDNSAINLQLQPHPDDVRKKIIIDDTTEESSCSEDEDRSDDLRVRFSDNVLVVDDKDGGSEYEHEGDTVLSTDMDAIELSQTSTPNERQHFHDFKKKLLGRKAVNNLRKARENESHQQQSNDQHCELKEKSELLKVRLHDLEIEIAKFREQNSAFIKMRQEIELEKIQLDHDREEMEEQLKDERMKVELYLHDERLKVEEQRLKNEKLLKESKNPNRKERDEVVKLKQTVEDLKEELKAKETRHGSAQARFRTQIRQLEKDTQGQKLEIDVLMKENRKLEVENARLRRETNNKMLQEINKNIAKLAPNVEEKKLPSTTVKAKVPVKPVKVPISRRSEPTSKNSIKKRFTSEPNLNAHTDEDEEITEATTSDEDEEQFTNRNNYFRKRGKENVPAKASIVSRKSEPALKVQSNESKVTSAEMLDAMKREIDNADGSKDIWYPNGNLKKLSPDGMLIRMLYYNKDIKETNIHEGTVKYYYADRNTWHTTYLDGLEILEYPDGQTEHRYKDGVIEVHYQDGNIRITNANSHDDVKEEWRYTDGTNTKIFRNDTKIIQFPNGQREIHTSNHKRREYPDGTVKLVYEDGSQETRYSNGRIRIKDKDGTLISDSESLK